MPPSLRLLLVEDCEDDAELICLELERAGFELAWRRVDTEDDFLHALEQENWELVISDFQMPGFDGLRAFSLFKQRGLDTPFIFVSGELGEDRAVEAMRAGARDYLLKGNLARLSVAVRRELEEAQSRARRRQMEREAEIERRRLAMAVEASGAGVFEHEEPGGPNTYRSKRWAEILGYSPDELPPYASFGDWLRERVCSDDLDVALQAYMAFVEGRTRRYAIEARLLHKQGHWVDIAIFARAVTRDAQSRATHIVGVMLDLTERRKLESQLRQAQKMEAIGRLAGGVAHDFNNLLTAMFGFGDSVLSRLQHDEAARRDMEEVLKAAERAEALTAQLLAFSRRKPVSPRTLSINELVRNMDRMLRRVVGEDIDVSIRLAPDLWNVRIDEGSLEQVIVNLAVNARDAMVEGGKLTLGTENIQIDGAYGPVHGFEVPAGDYVLLAVSDDGTGMDQATQRHIFEPFFSTKGSKGTGLGLSTCYGILKQAGGYIMVYSELGVGTTFKIYLPRVTDEADRVEVRAQPKNVRGSERILVVEDDEQVRKLAVRTLSRLGYQVIEASNGSEAARKSHGLRGAIQLLLTDVVMPEMSGEQLAAILTASCPGLKVLYMSGYASDAIFHRGALDSDSHVIQKPFTSDKLAQRIRALLDGEV